MKFFIYSVFRPYKIFQMASIILLQLRTKIISILNNTFDFENDRIVRLNKGFELIYLYNYKHIKPFSYN